jgi:hypothetical protein
MRRFFSAVLLSSSLLSTALSGLVLLSSSPSLASSERRLRVLLEVESEPGGCIVVAELQAHVAEKLGYSPFVAAEPADIVLRASVMAPAANAPAEAAWKATLTMSSAEGQALGERTVEGTDATCSSLEQALAFVVSLVVDSPATQQAVLAAEERAETTKESKPTPSQVSAPKVSRPTEAAKVREEESDRPSVGLAVRGQSGLLPSIAWGAAGVGRLPLGSRLAVHAELGAWLPQSSVDADGAGAKYSGGDLSVQLCHSSWQGRSLTFGPCFGGTAGVFWLSGTGLDRSDSHLRPSVDAVASLRLGTSLRAALFSVGVGAVYALSRDRVTFEQPDDGLRVVSERPALGARADIAFGWQIP